MKAKIISLSLILFCSIFSLPQTVYCRQNEQNIIIEKNQTFALELLSRLSTATNQKGDKFDCKVVSPLEFAGAIVSGQIRKAKRSGKADKKSEMDLAFVSITLVDGRTANFDAQVKEVNEVANVGNNGVADAEGMVKAKSRVKVSVKRAVAGAIAGGIIGGLLGGAKGAAIGASIGSSIALTSTLATDGPDLEFKQGTQFTVIINAPSRRRGGEAAPTLARRPVPVASSETYRAYNSTRFSLNVPDNWREYPSGGGVALAPEGGYGTYDGKPGLTHGVMLGIVPAQGRNLQQATELLINGLLRANTHLSPQGNHTSGMINGHNARSAMLAGRWPATGQVETLTIYTSAVSGGDIFFLIATTPEEYLTIYQPIFLSMVRSIRFNE